jgi:hypothetical protein
MGKKLEGSGCDLIQDTFLEFVWKDQGELQEISSQPRFESSTPKYKCRLLPLDQPVYWGSFVMCVLHINLFSFETSNTLQVK